MPLASQQLRVNHPVSNKHLSAVTSETREDQGHTCTVRVNTLYLAAFTGTFQGVVDVLCEWGSLFVITMENKVRKLNLKNA